MPRLLPWLDERSPDVVCLQETKLGDAAFEQLSGASWPAAATPSRSTARCSGTASRSSLASASTTSSRGSPDAPGFPAPEARAVAATCAGVRVHSVYVPNGREPDSEHYRYKLAWLAALEATVAGGPDAVVVCGDMNIAPADADVFDPDAYIGQTHVTPPEREALARLLATGLHDVVRDRWATDRVFTYWDYRAGMFHQDLGMRIDLVLAARPVVGSGQGGVGGPSGAQGLGPSDHAPVIVDLDVAPDGDIGPSSRRRRRRAAARGTRKLPQSSG